jgi:hypothetical protein
MLADVAGRAALATVLVAVAGERIVGTATVELDQTIGGSGNLDPGKPTHSPVVSASRLDGTGPGGTAMRAFGPCACAAGCPYSALMTASHERQLPDGHVVVLRLAGPGDVPAITRLYLELSPESFYRRLNTEQPAPALVAQLASIRTAVPASWLPRHQIPAAWSPMPATCPLPRDGGTGPDHHRQLPGHGAGARSAGCTGGAGS